MLLLFIFVFLFIVTMFVHIASEFGKRKENEDEHLVILNIDGKYPKLAPVNLFCVFDGHGGSEVSAYLKQNYYKYIMHIGNKYPLEGKIISTIYNKLQDDLSKTLGKNAINTGSTACSVIQYRDKGNTYIQAINLGDSRLVVNTNNIGFALTKDHKPEKIDEKKRIERLGGKIKREARDVDWRIKTLSVSRAFGDMMAKPYVDHIPEYIIKKITKDDKFLVLACDGLWDVMCSQEVVDYVLSKMKYSSKGELVLKQDINIARSLAKYAIDKKNSTDNVTIVFIFLG